MFVSVSNRHQGNASYMRVTQRKALYAMVDAVAIYARLLVTKTADRKTGFYSTTRVDFGPLRTKPKTLFNK